MDSPDNFIKHATEDAWEAKKLADAQRAQTFELNHWLPREALAAMTPEQYRDQRWIDDKDKKGEHHLRNMVASTMQSAKSLAGSLFEAAVEALMDEHDIGHHRQTNIGEDGRVYLKKSAHRIDGHIPQSDASAVTVRDSYVLSIKTTLRERWNQDVWVVPLCKGLVFLTRETPNSSTIESIRQHKAAVVFPDAPITDHTWSYAEFLRRMKDFQK